MILLSFLFIIYEIAINHSLSENHGSLPGQAAHGTRHYKRIM